MGAPWGHLLTPRLFAHLDRVSLDEAASRQNTRGFGGGGRQGCPAICRQMRCSHLFHKQKSLGGSICAARFLIMCLMHRVALELFMLFCAYGSATFLCQDDVVCGRPALNCHSGPGHWCAPQGPPRGSTYWLRGLLTSGPSPSFHPRLLHGCALPLMLTQDQDLPQIPSASTLPSD